MRIQIGDLLKLHPKVRKLFAIIRAALADLPGTAEIVKISLFRWDNIFYPHQKCNYLMLTYLNLSVRFTHWVSNVISA
jgi:hypothetical protein